MKCPITIFNSCRKKVIVKYLLITNIYQLIYGKFLINYNLSVAQTFLSLLILTLTSKPFYFRADWQKSVHLKEDA